MSSVIFLDRIEEIDRREVRLLGLAFAFLLFIAIAMLIAPVVRQQSWSALGSRFLHLLVLPIWLTCVWLLRRELRRVRPHRDPVLLPVGSLLAGWGMLLVWRLAPDFGLRQTGWFIVGTCAMLFVFRLPSDLRWLRRYRYLWLIAGVTLTALTLIFGTNPSGVEPRLWLGCCGIYLQPSEPLRLLLIAFVASYLADHLAFRWAEGSPPWIPTLVPLIVIWGLSVVLLVVQRDLGTGMLYLVILAVLLYLVSRRWQVLFIAVGLAVIGARLGYGLLDVVRIRTEAWLNPWQDPIGGSYQLVQGLIAIASGGVFGRGVGIGAPTFVPVVHSDFVFAAVLEEWGLLGGLGIVALFAILVARGLRAAARSRDPFATILAAGLAVAFGLQSILILGGTIRLLPLAGITLPFVSYGGSSLVTSLLALSFLLLLSGGGGSSESFARPIRNIQIGLTCAWVGVALVLGWWSLYRASVLTARTDNPRRGISELYTLRGRILDRLGKVLAESVGERGDFQRLYPDPWAVTVVGFNSLSYGQSGVESSMDLVLRGEEGHPTLDLWWSHLLWGNPPHGLDVGLTIDTNLQKAAAEALSGHKGSIVILDAKSGEILAMVSSPSFNPNRLEQDWATLTTREDGPLLNRATQGRYQPGMAMTPFVLAWAQAMEVADSNDRVSGMTEPFKVQGATLTCRETSLSGRENTLAGALRLGCPGPFVKLGEMLGGEGLSEMVQGFGLDVSPSIRLEHVLIQSFPEPLGVDDLRAVAIGQGPVTVTPLQMARAFATFLRAGSLPALQVVREISTTEGTWQEQSPLDTEAEVIPHEISSSILEALMGENGNVLAYSAEAFSGSETGKLAWFFGADLDNPSPRLVMVVLEEATLSQARQAGEGLLGLDA